MPRFYDVSPITRFAIIYPVPQFTPGCRFTRFGMTGLVCHTNNDYPMKMVRHDGINTQLDIFVMIRDSAPAIVNDQSARGQ